MTEKAPIPPHITLTEKLKAKRQREAQANAEKNRTFPITDDQQSEIPSALALVEGSDEVEEFDSYLKEIVKDNEQRELGGGHSVENNSLMLEGNAEDSLRLYFQDIPKYSPISPDEETFFAERIKEGDEKARAEFIKRNLRLVISIAKRYRNRGLGFDELIQYGNIGLIEAVDRFESERGWRFSTYATIRITKEITDGLTEQSRSFRLPPYVGTEIRSIKRTSSLLKQEFGREPLDTEVINALGWSEEKYEYIKRAITSIASLNAKIDQNEDRELGDIVVDTAACIDEQVVNDDSNAMVIKLLDGLSDREKYVLTRRFGLGEFEEATLNDLATELSLSRTRISQIEIRAMEKLRKARDAQGLFLAEYSGKEVIEKVDTTQTDRYSHYRDLFSQNQGPLE